MEAPVAVAVPLEIGERIAAPHDHVADVELVADHARVRSLHEQIVRHGAVDRRHVIGFVVEGEPDAGAPRRRTGGVEAVGPFPPIVERAGRVRREARHDEVFVTEPLGDGEASLPPDKHDGGRDVRRGRAQSFAIEGRPDLLGGAAEITKRPEQLDIRVPHGAHGGEGALGVPAHRVPDRIELEPDTVEAARGAHDAGRPRSGRERGAEGVDERSPVHASK